jgi:transposase
MESQSASLTFSSAHPVSASGSSWSHSFLSLGLLSTRPAVGRHVAGGRNGAHALRSSLPVMGGQAGAAIQPLCNAHRRFVLGYRVLQADATTAALLAPLTGRTLCADHKAHGRPPDHALPGAACDFCFGRN